MNTGAGTLEFTRNLPPPREPSIWQTAAGQRIAWTEYGDPAGRPVIYFHARLDVDPGEGHFSLAIRRARDAMDHLAASIRS